MTSKSLPDLITEFSEDLDAENSIFFSESNFCHMLRLEKRRVERSGKTFLLVLLDCSHLLNGSGRNFVTLERMRRGLSFCFRETDIKGWYERDRVIGVVLTEMASVDERVEDRIHKKIFGSLCRSLSSNDAKKIEISFHVYPEDPKNCRQNGWYNPNLHLDVTGQKTKSRITLFIKRVWDIMVSSFVLVTFSPFLLVIALAIKLTSKGPVFFRQERMGFRGEKFIFLKFRSMYMNCDEQRHKDYIEKFIQEQQSAASRPGEEREDAQVYKLQEDPRITPIGRFLRRTSFDEFPQFINVLRGEMSLVGPRPPIPYEFDLYGVWHRRRLLEARPGITGLWQVEGRSSTTFDEMVRLDLRYIREWSLWLDIKILLKTPWVVLTCRGAY
jgi:lipopolysaccharide/colanic/teichoic acid biosynthesis glycosyltransferase